MAIASQVVGRGTGSLRVRASLGRLRARCRVVVAGRPPHAEPPYLRRRLSLAQQRDVGVVGLIQDRAGVALGDGGMVVERAVGGPEVAQEASVLVGVLAVRDQLDP